MYDQGRGAGRFFEQVRIKQGFKEQARLGKSEMRGRRRI